MILGRKKSMMKKKSDNGKKSDNEKKSIMRSII